MPHLKSKSWMFLAALAVGLAGCANPLNRVTHDRYWEEGAAAERAGQLGVAEGAYYRALVNVDMGNLGPLLKAQGLYNLGRVKIRVRKYAEAEDLLRQSLGLDEKILKPDDLDTDRCLVELAAAFAGESKWIEGSAFLERVLPYSGRFTGGEREYMLGLFGFYGAELRKAGQEARAKVFDRPST